MPFRLALALLMQSPEQWAAARRSALAYTLRAHLQPAPGASSGRSSAAEANPGAGSALWPAAAPAVRLFGMVDELQRALKAPPEASDCAVGWEAAMGQR